MPTLLPAAENPYDPDDETRHAGKVFVLTQGVLRAVNVTSSDGAQPSVLADRLLLCLWDVDDGRSLWIELQSLGEFEIPHAAKRLYAGTDPNWMNEQKVSHYRDGTVWRLGRPNMPFKHHQTQQRAVIVEELHRIRNRISQASIDCLINN